MTLYASFVPTVLYLWFWSYYKAHVCVWGIPVVISSLKSYLLRKIWQNFVVEAESRGKDTRPRIFTHRSCFITEIFWVRLWQIFANCSWPVKDDEYISSGGRNSNSSLSNWKKGFEVAQSWSQEQIFAVLLNVNMLFLHLSFGDPLPNFFFSNKNPKCKKLSFSVRRFEFMLSTPNMP